MTVNGRALLAAVLGGLVFALCSPPFDLLPGIWLGLAVLHWVTVDAPRARTAFLRGWVWAASAALLGMRFIPGVVDRFTPLGVTGGVAALVLLALGQGVSWGLGALLARGLARRVGLPEPVAFATAMTVASTLTLVIAWSPGALLSPWLAAVQLAEFVGERGVTFLVALVAALCVEPLRHLLGGARRPWQVPLAIAAGVGVLQFGSGALLLEREARAQRERPTLRVGVLQPAVEAKLRWEPAQRQEILSHLRTLTMESEAEDVDLTVWPEAAYPYPIAHGPHRTRRGREAIIGGGVRGPVLFGVLTQAPDGQGRHNSATIVDRDAHTQLAQAKMELLWFGETVPLSSVFPVLRRWFFRAGGLVPGDSVNLLTAGPARIGVLNCFEDTLPAVGRRLMAHEPNLLVNVTNDAWFPAPEPEFHLRLSVLRAIELRRDLVRAVNLGAAGWIDSTGRVRARADETRANVIVVTPALNDGRRTLYARFGDAPLLAVVLGWGLVALGRRRRRAQ